MVCEGAEVKEDMMDWRSGEGGERLIPRFYILHSSCVRFTSASRRPEAVL